jgi:glucans biosynthesis protein
MYFDTPVAINEVTATRYVRSSTARITSFWCATRQRYGERPGLAGFKVLYPINSKDKNDEIVSMLGASFPRLARGSMGFLRVVWLLIPRCHQVKSSRVSVSSGLNVQNQRINV